jgi:aminoglycoside phosphotransferase (APT) family kinase protein
VADDGPARLRQVLATLGLEPPPPTSAPPPDLGSPERTHVYVVGDLVVKCDARDGSQAMIREANALTLLADTDINVPTLVAIGTFDDGRGWVVTERLPGEVPPDAAGLAHDLSPGLATQLGTLIAAVHRAVTPPGFGTWTDTSSPPRSLRTECEHRLAALARMGFARDPLIVERHELDEVVRLGRQTLDALDDWPTPVLAHRDVQPRNVLVTGDRLTALLDFESAGGGDPTEDFNVLALDWTTPGYAAFSAAYARANGSLGPGAADRLTHHVLRWILSVYAYLGRIVPASLAPARQALARLRDGERPPVP